MSGPPLRILSLGAGVQSSCVLLMSIEGELDHLDAAIFSDTGWEPAAVYAHLARLEDTAAMAGVPVHRVSAGNLRADALDPAHRFASMPLHVRNSSGAKGMIRRQCTREYKLDPIRRKVREVYEAAGRRPVEQWLGISLDEIGRMRTSDVRYITHRYPLVEQRMTRWDCQRWLGTHGWNSVPKSSCIGCPFHSDRQWRGLRDNAPQEFADAVEFDRAIRSGHVQPDGKVQLLGEAYLHHTLVPLDEADLSTPEDRGQLNLFENDCQSGVCGL